jgi:hypothetical protein
VKTVARGVVRISSQNAQFGGVEPAHPSLLNDGAREVVLVLERLPVEWIVVAGEGLRLFKGGIVLVAAHVARNGASPENFCVRQMRSQRANKRPHFLHELLVWQPVSPGIHNEDISVRNVGPELAIRYRPSVLGCVQCALHFHGILGFLKMIVSNIPDLGIAAAHIKLHRAKRTCTFDLVAGKEDKRLKH